jgi:hypothetical protein
VHRRCRRESDLAYRRGRSEGLAAARPFQGVKGLVRFPDEQPSHDAVARYERALLEALPEAYSQIRIAQRSAERGSDSHANDETSRQAAEAVRDDLVGEIERVRQWLDAFVKRAEEYVAARPDLRGQVAPPSLPPGTREYDSIEEFVAENRRRGVSDWETRKVATGADFGYDWTWQDPKRPWVVSTWRVSYIDELKEVYACENAQTRYTRYVSFDGEDKRPRAVVLLRSDFEVDAPPRADGEENAWPPMLLSFPPTWEFLSELQGTLMRQRNSLVLLADALSRQSA